MKKSIKVILSLVTTLLALPCHAQDDQEKREENFDFNNNRVAFSGALTSSDSYQLEFSYHYMFNRYIGLGSAFGFWKVLYEEGRASGNDWKIESDDNKPYNIYLRPSLILKSPALKIKKVDIGIFAEPGVMLNLPFTSAYVCQYTHWPDYKRKWIHTTGGQWFAVDLRAGIYVNIGPIGISAGYMLSNHDVYSQYRHLSYKGHSFAEYYPKKPFMQGAYLNASFYF